MANLGNISKLTINNDSLTIKDASLTNTVVQLTEIISENNEQFTDRINDLNDRLEEIESTNYKNQYLTIELVTDGTITIKANNASLAKTISYSIDDGSTWNDISTSTTAQTIGSSYQAGQKILLKGLNNIYATSSYYTQFGGTAQYKVYGNIMSLIYGDDFGDQTSFPSGSTYNFSSLFLGSTNLVDASNLVLPATTLTSSCYIGMFQNCTSLMQAPELPATTLASNCYNSMFSGCKSLIIVPELPATTLKDGCYTSMFYGCTSIIKAPELPATTLKDGCYTSMFYGCTSIIKAPELPGTTLSSNCYNSMFWGCTSLTQAPELPATTLATSCYQNMFRGCSNLTQAPELPATTLANDCYSYMFYGCTSLTQAPELPATTLADYCYIYMFRGCSKLNYIKALFTTAMTNSSYTSNWVSGVASSGTFVKNANATLPIGDYGIPNGWIVQNDMSTQDLLDKVEEATAVTKDLIYVESSHNLYLDRGDDAVIPLHHPDISTQPSLLSQRFGKQYIYEVLIPVNTSLTSNNTISNGSTSSIQILWDDNTTNLLYITEGGAIPSNSTILSISLFGSDFITYPSCKKITGNWTNPLTENTYNISTPTWLVYPNASYEELVNKVQYALVRYTKAGGIYYYGGDYGYDGDYGYGVDYGYGDDYGYDGDYGYGYGGGNDYDTYIRLKLTSDPTSYVYPSGMQDPGINNVVFGLDSMTQNSSSYNLMRGSDTFTLWSNDYIGLDMQIYPVKNNLSPYTAPSYIYMIMPPLIEYSNDPYCIIPMQYTFNGSLYSVPSWSAVNTTNMESTLYNIMSLMKNYSYKIYYGYVYSGTLYIATSYSYNPTAEYTNTGSKVIANFYD